MHLGGNLLGHHEQGHFIPRAATAPLARTFLQRARAGRGPPSLNCASTAIVIGGDGSVNHSATIFRTGIPDHRVPQTIDNDI